MTPLYGIANLKRALHHQELADLARRVAGAGYSDETDQQFIDMGRVGTIRCDPGNQGRIMKHFARWRPPNPHVLIVSGKSVKLLGMKRGSTHNKHQAAEGQA